MGQKLRKKKFRDLPVSLKIICAFVLICCGLTVVSGIVYYVNARKVIVSSILNQISLVSDHAVREFNAEYSAPVEQKLGLLATSPQLNNYLMSSKDELLLYNAEMEKLFLSASRGSRIHLSLRFLDGSGKERIIICGNKRKRNYRALEEIAEDDILGRNMKELFNDLKSDKDGTLSCTGPFRDAENRLGFLAGITKLEPEAGGFGGVIMQHCDLTDYIHRLSKVKIAGTSVIWVYSRNGENLLSPPDGEARRNPMPFISQGKEPTDLYISSAACRLVPNGSPVLTIVCSVPREIISKELVPIIMYTVMLFSILLAVSLICAFLISRWISEPIKKLTKVTENISREIFDFDLDPKLMESRDEIGMLATAFNTMTNRLRQILGSLKAEIAERKQAEEERVRLSTAIEQAKETVMIVGADGIVQYVNPALEYLMGYSRDEIIGKNLSSFEKAGNQYGRFQEVWEILNKGDVWSGHITEKRRDGSNCELDVTVSPVRDRSGKITSIVSMGRDITKELAMEEQLRQAQKMEAIGTLAGGVAHDLNNILSGIVSYPELLLLKLPQDSLLRKPIITIQESGQRAAAIVQDLLTLARRGVAVTEVLSLNDVISDYLGSPEFERLKSFHFNVRFKTELETDLLNILGSPVHLSKTVMNLVSNASEAATMGGEVIISTENRYADKFIRGFGNLVEGDYVILKVSDTGTGIPSKDIERIFEPFYTKKKMGRSGTGLGMTVVWGTVQDHKGYVDVQSREGKGTTFTLYFPATRKEIARDESHLSIEDYMGEGETILVVDDIKEQREIASSILNELGYSVTTVSSGEEAVEYMKNNSSDLLVLDMIMDPGIDGFETYRRILKIHPSQKAIIASGFSETDRVKKAQKLGSGKYIKKPYTLEKIGLAVKTELEKQA